MLTVYDLIYDQLIGQTIMVNGKEIEVRDVKKSKGDSPYICECTDGEESIFLYPNTKFSIR